MAYARNKHGPGYSAKKPIHVGINRSPCDVWVEKAESTYSSALTRSPKLDASQSIAENVYVWDKSKDLIRNART